MSRNEALELIDENLGPAVADLLLDGQADGSHPEWQYDGPLIEDIAKAVKKWKDRITP